MLTGLRLGNFKAFADTQYIPIRPLTLIFGANSAGKSSVIHSLLLARHALERNVLDVHQTDLGGEAVDLGGFRQFLHRHEASRRLEWAVQINPAALGGEFAEVLSSTRCLEVKVTAGLATDKDGRAEAGARPHIQSFAIEADGAVLLKMSGRGGGLLQLDRLDPDHPITHGLMRHIVRQGLRHARLKPLKRLPVGKISELIGELVPHTFALAEGLLPPNIFDVRKHQREESLGAGRDLGSLRDLLHKLNAKHRTSLDYLISSHLIAPGSIKKYKWDEDVIKALDRYLIPNLGELVHQLSGAARRELYRLQYLGPLRTFPSRHLTLTGSEDPNWFAGGGHAWEVVLRDEDVRRLINEWLGDEKRLQTRYELIVRELVPDQVLTRDIPEKLSRALHDVVRDLVRESAEGGGDGESLMVTAQQIMEEYRQRENGQYSEAELLPSIESLLSRLQDPLSLSQSWVDDFIASKAEPLRDLVLLDKNTRTPVSHRDVGIGISQVLPVLVTAYASKNKILAMEQPEIHLHPALQAELGDVFIESALGERKNTMILETHSEHLMLRILRRIRETSEGELPDGVVPIKPEQVAVLYVDASASGSQVVEIPIRPDGEFTRQWPRGFFDDRAKELF